MGTPDSESAWQALDYQPPLNSLQIGDKCAIAEVPTHTEGWVLKVQGLEGFYSRFSTGYRPTEVCHVEKHREEWLLRPGRKTEILPDTEVEIVDKFQVE